MNGLKMFLVSGAVVAALVVSLMWDGSAPESADTIFVYCAANMRKAVEAAAEDYEKEFGIQIELDIDGSGTLLGKIGEEKASEKKVKRGDLYLAADQSYIAEARKRGLVVEEFPLARMRPVIAVRRGNPKSIRGIQDLLRDEVEVAICNPEQAAVGRTARKALQEAKIWDKVAERVEVMKPKVTDLANDVTLGSVDAAVVWDSTVAMYEKLEAIRVPEFDARVMNVTIAVTSYTASPPSALRFARFLSSSDRGLPHFKSFGFDVVEGDAWEKKPELVVWSGGVNRLAIKDTIDEFEAREGVTVLTTFNGCGTLTANMQPAWGTSNFPDVYFACDRVYMDNVSDWFQGSDTVSETDIVIAVPKGNPKNVKPLRVVGAEGRRIGIADEKKAALGALTVQLLKDDGVYAGVSKNIDTTAGTADYLVNQIAISRGNTLDAVLVYQANLPNVLDKVDVIKIDHPSAKAAQPIATARSSTRKQLSRRFIQALFSGDSKSRFQDVGFRWLYGRDSKI